jgi:hypothetical protein
VRRVLGAWTTVFVYDAFGQVAAEYDSGTRPPDAVADCTTCYLFADHLGSTRAVWDGTGVKARYDYLPFGEPVADRNGRGAASCAAGVAACFPSNGDVRQRLGTAREFTGKERDADERHCDQSRVAVGLILLSS